MKINGVKSISYSLNIYCKAFEHNSGDLELACTPKLSMRTRNINVIYHHFRLYVRYKSISIFPIDMPNQITDIFTKALTQNELLRHQKKYLKY